MSGAAALTAAELLAGYGAGRLSPVEALAESIARIGRLDPRLRAFGAFCLDRAETEARESERRWREGSARPLEGVPFVAKDLFDTEGVTTTYGSPMFAANVPDADADAVRLAREAGAILLGKTATHEFAWGITSHNAHFGWGANPWDTSRVTGGSSGGSGAAVAALFAPLALGTDTGGSIRIPAAFCGVSGLKPTYGRVSARGVFPLARSLDHVGTLARSPQDALLFLSVVAGGDAHVRSGPSVSGLRIGVPSDLMPVQSAPDVEAVFLQTVALLAEAGARIVVPELPDAPEILPAYRVVQGAEAVDSHRRAGLWPDRRGEYGEDVRGRLAASESIGLAEYLEATLVRERVRAGFGRLFAEVDLLLTPVSPSSPVALGEEELPHRGAPALFRDLVLPYTTPQNFVGLPACTVRAGFDELGMPVGVQLTGPPGAEAVTVAAAQALYDATPELQAVRPALAA